VIDIRQFRYFEAIGSTLNFSRAAERLHMAQPPLSRQIQQLEEELGVALIDRSVRPFVLTRAGSFFYEQSVQMLARVNEVVKATRRVGAGQRRWLGVGFVPSVLYGFLPRTVQQFTSDHPELDVILSELTSVQQVEALRAGRIDIGFGRLRVDAEGIDNTLLAEEPLVVVLPETSPLAKHPDVSMADLLQEVLVIYPSQPRPSFADQVLSQFRVRGYAVEKTYETNGLQTAIGLVAAGMGVTVVGSSVQRLQRDDVVYLPFREQGVTTPLIMSTRSGEPSADLARFRELVVAANPTNPTA
jgi:DNA-binding transcriptional LysR family regulator